jgi:hypothetical protein
VKVVACTSSFVTAAVADVHTIREAMVDAAGPPSCTPTTLTTREPTAWPCAGGTSSRAGFA